jgi:stress response protein SCP2
MSLLKGQKVKLDENVFNQEAKVQIKYVAPFAIDISCFGLDENGKLSDENYMVFYNQKASPNNEVKLDILDSESNFLISLSKLPTHINKLVFTAAIDASVSQTMNNLNSLEFLMNELSFKVTGADFVQEKAIMITEIYKKDGVWRLGVNGQGFKGGLEDLLVYFGGSSVESSQHPETKPAEVTPTVEAKLVEAIPQPVEVKVAPVVEIIQPTPVSVTKVSLEKRFEQKAPKLVNLVKQAVVSLEKNNLSKVRAKAAFVLDASGSMTSQYNRGQVQETLNRVFPLGVHFDDDEELETWAFANKSKKLSNVTFSNYENYVNKENRGWRNWMSELNSAYNNEPAVIKDVIKHFSGLSPTEPQVEKKGFLGFGKKLAELSEFAPQIESKTPVFVLFISDGGVAKDDEIEFLIKWSSTLPIFWQFIGIGGSSYGALEKLDDMKGRYLDNADFFSIDDLNQISESELYDRMMTEFPKWLEAAYAKGIIDNYKV